MSMLYNNGDGCGLLSKWRKEETRCYTDSTKINRPGHNVRMYWTNLPTDLSTSSQLEVSVDTYPLRKVFKGILQDLKSPELSSLDLIKHEMSSKKEWKNWTLHEEKNPFYFKHSLRCDQDSLHRYASITFPIFVVRISIL